MLGVFDYLLTAIDKHLILFIEDLDRNISEDDDRLLQVQALLDRINSAMEQKGYNYRFLNLKNGNLRLSIQLDGEKNPYSTAMDSFDALAGLK